MRRGELSNVGAPQVWVRFDVVYRRIEPGAWNRFLGMFSKKFGHARVEQYPNIDNWLWRVGHDVKPVIVLCGDESIYKIGLPEMVGHYLKFPTFQHCISAFRQSSSVIDIVVQDGAELTADTRLYDGDGTYYGGKA